MCIALERCCSLVYWLGSAIRTANSPSWTLGDSRHRAAEAHHAVASSAGMGLYPVCYLAEVPAGVHGAVRPEALAVLQDQRRSPSGQPQKAMKDWEEVLVPSR